MKKSPATIRVAAGDWIGNYKTTDGREAIKMFFRDILSGKIKFCQLSPLGTWLRNDGEEIPFRIAPAMFKAGKLTMEGLVATLKQCDLDFTRRELKEMVKADSWMLE